MGYSGPEPSRTPVVGEAGFRSRYPNNGRADDHMDVTNNDGATLDNAEEGELSEGEMEDIYEPDVPAVHTEQVMTPAHPIFLDASNNQSNDGVWTENIPATNISPLHGNTHT